MGKEWDPRNYLVTEDGSKYLGPLSVDEIDPSLPFDNFLVHPEQEPEINLKRLQEDTAQLKSEEKRVNALSMGTVAGALYVDTRNLRNILIQIPIDSFEDIEKTLNRLFQYKVDLLKNSFDKFIGMMKVECKTMDLFVDFCDLLKKINSYTPEITEIIRFVDSMLDVFAEYEFEPRDNPLHELYDSCRS